MKSASGLELLGVASPERRPISLPASALALGAGALASMLWPAHRVLAFLDGAAIASNLHAVATGDRTWRQAGKRLGRHFMATAGSLALPAYPAIGYLAAAIAADLLLDGEGGGVIEEWARFEDLERSAKPDVVDVSPKSNTQNALVTT